MIRYPFDQPFGKIAVRVNHGEATISPEVLERDRLK
jgi:hypothetical protein